MLAWFNQKRNVVFHVVIGSAGAIAAFLDQLKLVDLSAFFGPKTGAVIALISLTSLFLHFTDERVHHAHDDTGTDPGRTVGVQ